MGGTRISMAKNALIELLKGLPKNSYFNIISYGTSYDSLYPNAKKATPHTIEMTIEKVKMMDANYGGTEIYNPMKYIYENLNVI